MRISMKWMNELVDLGGIAPEALTDRLDMSGTAVEAIETVGEALDGIVVGRVVTKERHPDADKLWVTTVDVGATEPLTIVCGAQNFEAGDRIPVALVGATLPNGMAIKKAKLRGVASEGMNCSAAELGLGTDQSGLMILPADAPIGTPFAQYHGLADTVLELEVTPNRPDCLSMAGMAREIAAVLGTSCELPTGSPAEAQRDIAESVRVDIEAPDLCGRYTARVIRNVKIGPSPEWLAQRVIASGARSVNNVVDITNYVMFEMGQPLHAFDLAKLGTDDDGRAHVIVRSAKPGEKVRTLDGQDRKLAEDMLLICDPTGPIALAGVMGGETTEVSESTVDILLESASFDSDVTSGTSRSLGLISEASMRFERGVDREGCAAASDRAAQLMAEYCGGEVDAGMVDEYPRPALPCKLTLRSERLRQVLGAAPESDEVVSILRALGMQVQQRAEDFEVVAPTFRPDLGREIDLVEEVLRVWGMDRVEATLPAGRARVGRLTDEQRWRERIAATLRAVGFHETITYAFVDPGDLGRLGWELEAGELLVEVLNPMSEEQAVMRRTLVPGLLRAVSYNQRRGEDNVHLYELGRVFVTSAGRKLPKEREMVAGVLAGRWREPAWHDTSVTDSGPDAALRGSTLNFFDGKGAIEALMNDLGIERWTARATEVPWLQPGRSAEIVIAGQVVGWVGEVHPTVARAFDVAAPVVLFELDVAHLTRSAVDVKPYTDVPRYPAVELDIALVVDEDVEAGRVLQVISKAGGSLLEEARLFDVYRGKGVAEGKKSLAYALMYRAEDRTLTDEDVRPHHERLISKVCKSVGAELRG